MQLKRKNLKKKLATLWNLMQLKCDWRAIKLFWVRFLIILKVMKFTLSRILFVSESSKVVLWLMWDVVQVRYCVDESILCQSDMTQDSLCRMVVIVSIHFLFCTVTNKCTIISQIITLLHVLTLPFPSQGACNQYLVKLQKYFKCSCW
jgi:hypothetical protein